MKALSADFFCWQQRGGSPWWEDLRGLAVLWQFIVYCGEVFREHAEVWRQTSDFRTWNKCKEGCICVIFVLFLHRQSILCSFENRENCLVLEDCNVIKHRRELISGNNPQQNLNFTAELDCQISWCKYHPKVFAMWPDIVKNRSKLWVVTEAVSPNNILVQLLKAVFPPAFYVALRASRACTFWPTVCGS